MSWYGSFAMPTGDVSPPHNTSPSDRTESPAVATDATNYFDAIESSANTNDNMSSIDTNEFFAILTGNMFSLETSNISASFIDLVSCYGTSICTDQNANVLIKDLETQIPVWDKETQDKLDMPSPPTPRPCMICDTKHYYKINCKNLKHATALCRTCWARYITNEISLSLDPKFCPLTFCRAKIPADEITKMLLAQQPVLRVARRAKVFKKCYRAVRPWPEEQKRLSVMIEKEFKKERKVFPMERLRIQHHNAQEYKRKLRAQVRPVEESEDEGRKVRTQAPLLPLTQEDTQSDGDIDEKSDSQDE